MLLPQQTLCPNVLFCSSPNQLGFGSAQLLHLVARCSNPSNWMWRILRDTGIAPAAGITGAVHDDSMPDVAGVGFTDVGSGTPGTDSSQFNSLHFTRWRPAFFARLEAQMRRASSGIGCMCGRCGAPGVVAFSGKRQFAELFPGGAAGGGGGGRGRKKGAAGKEAAAAAATLGSDIAPSPSLAGPELAPLAAQPVDCGRAVSAGGKRQPCLQACRPSNIPVGRQWVLPAGWPLPLDAEVSCWVLDLVLHKTMAKCIIGCLPASSVFIMRVSQGQHYKCMIKRGTRRRCADIL